MAAKKAAKHSQGATRKQQEEQAASPTVNVAAWFNRLLIIAAAGLVVTAGTQAWMYLRAIPVEHIRVSGQLENLQREQIESMVQPALVGGFLSADLRRIRRELESLPWVYQVSARRRWPSSLELHVVEQLPIARWGEAGFVNHSGEVFHSGREGDWDSLPSLLGPDKDSARQLMAHYLRLIDLLQPLQLELRELTMDQRGQLRARFDGGMQLIIGNSEFIERVQRFVAIYPAQLKPRAGDIESVDLRYDSGLAVAFSQIEPEPDTQVAGLQ